jgi:glycosyltransferase involved in cell wall biosynthesis
MKLFYGKDLMANSPKGIVYAIGRDGHRGAYLDLFADMFNLEACKGALDKKMARRLWKSERLMFATLDDTVIGFAFIALLRSLTGRLTVGIMLRSQSCRADGTVVQRIKYWLFHSLSSMPSVSVFSILPHSLRPEVASVSSGWVHDPQLWDYIGNKPDPDLDLCAAITERAAGRRVLVFIGSISFIKGISLLAAVAEDLAKDFLIVVAGKALPDVDDEVRRLISAGAMVEVRRVSDQEIEALYEMADLVWCCYHPDYDQASGIFGRAVQFGRAVVVREGAMIAKYGHLAPISNVPVPWDDLNKAVQRIRDADKSGIQPAETLSMVKEWRSEFRERIAGSL